MSDTTRWWWIRHAPVRSNGKIYGGTDLPCDCSDSALFRNLAAALPVDALWVVTHLQRTRQTAEAIWQTGDSAVTPTPFVEADLGEQDFGDWHGLTVEEVERERGDAWHRFWLAPAHERPPGGESFLQVLARASAAIERLSAEHRGRDIVAVAHGGTIRAALALALDLDPERALAFSIENCSLTRIDHIAGPAGSHAPTADGVWRVAQVNISADQPIAVPRLTSGFARTRPADPGGHTKETLR